MRKGWVISGILVVGIGGAIAAGLYYQRKAEAQQSPFPPDTYIAAVTRGTITQSVQSTGEVISNLDVAIKCQASGEVTELPFDISDHVKKGDLLVQLDPVDENVLVKQAQVTLDQAKSKLVEAQETERQGELDLATATQQAKANVVSAIIKADNLRRKADRQKELLAQKLASQEDYETAETDAASAEADLATAKIAVEELKSQAVALEVKKEDVKLAQETVDLDQIALDNALQQRSYCTVNSPIDGVVSDLEIEKGTVIASAISNVGGGTTVMTVSDLSRIFVNASVDESDIGNVRVGQKVAITADSYPGKQFTGKVVRIATTGVNTSNVVTFEVKIEVTSENKSLLKPEMTTNVSIIEAVAKNVIEVPALAVIHHDQKDFVTIVKPDNTTEERAVTLGITDGNNDEIKSGLSGDEQLLVYKNESNNHWTSNAAQRQMNTQNNPHTAAPSHK